MDVDLDSPFFIKYRKMFLEMDDKTDHKIVNETIKRLKADAQKELLEDLKYQFEALNDKTLFIAILDERLRNN